MKIANGGQDGSSFQHLTALRHLAPQILGHVESIPAAYESAVAFGRELYAYFLAVSCIGSPDAARDAIIQETESAFRIISDHGYSGAMLGCSDELFGLVPDVAASLRKARKYVQPYSDTMPCDTTSSSRKAEYLITDVVNLESKISSLLLGVSMWVPSRSSYDTFQKSGRIGQLALTVLLAEASHWCSVFRANLCKTDEPPSSNSISLESQTEPLVAEFVTLLEELPSHSYIATTMCWSVAVLGSYATCQSHRSVIRCYLVNMEQTFGFKNMNRTRLLLEHIWSKIRTFETDRPLDISEAMAQIGGHFLLG